MSKWVADFTNDPTNDFNLVVEILYNDEDVAVIRQGEEGLELKWYARNTDLTVPLDWVMEILIRAKNGLKE